MPKFEWSTVDAHYVNLASRTDRRTHMEQELARAGIKATRQPGLLPHEVNVAPELVKVMRDRTPGAIGCHYAQRAIIAHGAITGHNVLVMEDDLVFCDDMAERMKEAEEFLADRPWDILWLGATFHVNPPVWHKDTLGRDIELTDHPRFVRTYGTWCTYAYVVNGDSASKVLTGLDGIVHKSMGIDWAMIQLQPQWQTYAYVPGCVKQMDNRSNIGNGITYFSGFAKLGPFWWQPRREDFDPSTFDWAEAKHDSQ